MTDSLDFVRFPVDWDKHDRVQARAALDITLDLAAKRHLKDGARRFKPPPGLLAAMNAALASRSPLLLTGDPGTGKTTTAYFLAEYFGLGQPMHFQVRSDSSARDLRFDFDAVAYLRDAYVNKIPAPADGSDPRADPRYLKKGKLWQAYEDTRECVLLIDEIDKAPRDFPNDILQELSDQEFDHPFGGAKINNQGPPPILVITSNGERVMPGPFLRRCIVWHIELSEDLLKDILTTWHEGYADRLQPGVEDMVISCFNEVLNRIKDRGRPPGIAEFLVWLNVLAVRRVEADSLEPKHPKDLPGLECLIKMHEDYALLG